MFRFFLVSVTGWLAVLGVSVEIALPYMLRNKFRRASRPAAREGATHAGLAQKSNPLAAMWPHYWLGYVSLGLVLVHAAFVMGPVMGRTNSTGIWAATLALFLLLLQVSLGLILKTGSINQRQVRRWHFSIMIAFVALISIHLLKNA